MPNERRRRSRRNLKTDVIQHESCIVVSKINVLKCHGCINDLGIARILWLHYLRLEIEEFEDAGEKRHR